ncbi:MAG: GGDEF domain-containing protein [Planctomycetota bacterium]|nr:GGDEF domain-containing protein [Planctomycetota bacterium]
MADPAPNVPVPMDASLQPAKPAARRVMTRGPVPSGTALLDALGGEKLEPLEENQMLRRLLRKQEHDFSTLFEIVGQTSARSLDLVSMQTYLLRTVSGHFTTPRLMIARQMNAEDNALCCSAAQGLRDVKLRVPVHSHICAEGLARRYCFQLGDLPKEIQELPETMALRELGMELAVPLIQEIESPETVLEGFLLLGPRLANRAYAPQDLDFLHALGKMLAICLRNESLYRRSIIDDLTGVASRGHFDARLQQEIARLRRDQSQGFGLVMLDIDHFKSFNDTYGHQTGDRVLQEMARVLVGQVRNVDMVARYGGEEFAIVLASIDRVRIGDVAERLRRAVERMQVEATDGTPLKITASFGAACCPGDADNKFELIKLADAALYRAKDGGRNRVMMASGLEVNALVETRELAALPHAAERAAGSAS